MSEMILLKLGGSVITRKSSAGMIDSDRLRFLANEIGAREGARLAVVHGAGSFGHPEARKYGIVNGVDASNLEGIFVTHSAVRRLNREVVSALRGGGCEAIGIHPLSSAIAKDGRLISMEYRPLSVMIGLGVVPILHGDVVMDLIKGATIVSGDQLVNYLARNLRFHRIGLATDVPGILDRDRVIPFITPDTVGSIDIGDSKAPDVTGGMKGKVREMIELARQGIRSEIFHVDRIGDFLDGKPHGGTVITG
ncbi:MAG TPA: isopentenyl phosphate kinase [Methanoregulaceae archaeon]|nr:isopentenyl phosphate kinase [Methanoregulaceae archaeon]